MAQRKTQSGELQRKENSSARCEIEKTRSSARERHVKSFRRSINVSGAAASEGGGQWLTTGISARQQWSGGCWVWFWFLLLLISGAHAAR